MPETSPLDPLPICLPCWREQFGLDESLPTPIRDWPEEHCENCGRRTNHGLYLLRGPADPHEGTEGTRNPDAR